MWRLYAVKIIILCFSLQIPRYIITLHELLAHTPHDHVERQSLEYAKSKLEELSRVSRQYFPVYIQCILLLYKKCKSGVIVNISLMQKFSLFSCYICPRDGTVNVCLSIRFRPYIHLTLSSSFLRLLYIYLIVMKLCTGIQNQDTLDKYIQIKNFQNDVVSSSCDIC